MTLFDKRIATYLFPTIRHIILYHFIQFVGHTSQAFQIRRNVTPVPRPTFQVTNPSDESVTKFRKIGRSLTKIAIKISNVTRLRRD
jgi:hypothetical protein